jgi:tetratricopeptide (TPR) repeat protein
MGITLSLLISLVASASQPVTPNDHLFPGLGSHGRTVTTRSEAAQKLFNQGLNFLYGFNHDEAMISFTAATEKDPGCAMAWWGVAMAQGPHINNPALTDEQATVASDAIAKARAAARSASALERAMIEAAAARYPAQRKDQAVLDKAYSSAMLALWRKNPRDADIGALYAESVMNLRPWDLWSPDGKPYPGTMEGIRALDAVFKINPNHPLACHLYIHAWEMSKTPERAEAAADRLRNLQPGLGHMVHMPSHIDVRTGKWRQAVLANEKAIAADRAYVQKRPKQGLYLVYMAHNWHMLAHAAMMIGQSRKAIDAFETANRDIPQEAIEAFAPFVDIYMVAPMEARVRFGQWDQVLAQPEYAPYLPLSNALRHMLRGVAFAAKGEVDSALLEQAAFKLAAERVPADYPGGQSGAARVLEVARHMLEGEIALAKGDLKSGIEILRWAVAAEDRLRYNEPPDWLIPTRHALGAALMAANRPSEAMAVYRKDLEILPQNGWSLYGMYQAAERLGRRQEAARHKAAFDKAWAGADVKITSSCMCLPAIR